MGPQPRHHSQYHAKLESDSLAVTVTVDIMVLTRIPESMIATPAIKFQLENDHDPIENVASVQNDRFQVRI
jgi:hypothetical protein